MHFIAYSILELLQKYKPRTNRPPGDERAFSDIAIIGQERSDRLDPSVLYIALQPETGYFRQLDGDICVLFSGDDIVYEESRYLACSCIVLEPITDMAAVANRLLDYKMQLWTWYQDLKCLTAAGADMQALLDRSEPLFQDPIIIMSKTLRVLAYTRHIPASHPDIAQTLRDGYFPKHMIQGLIEKRYLQAAEQFYAIGYHYPPNYIGCTKIIKVFGDNGLQAHTICLYGLSQAPTPQTLHYMKILVGFLEQLIRKAGKTKETFERRNICLLVDMIEKDLTEQEINSKAALMHWPCSCKYRVCVVEFANYFHPYVQFVINYLQSEKAFFATFEYRERIVALQRADSFGDQDNCLLNYRELFQDNGACCGQSSAFSQLHDFRRAYRQAVTALELGLQLMPKDVIYSYEKFLPCHLLKIYSKENPLEYLYADLVELLEQGEKNGQTGSHLALLESLLRNERNITAVAQEMHMHRNSILYRVDKLQRQLGLSLDDPDNRLTLQLALKAYHLSSISK